MEDVTTSIPLAIVKIASGFLIGILLLSAMVGDISGTASTTFHFSQQPHDGDTITVDSHIFEFDSGDGVADGNVAVTIGSTLAETSENLKTAVGAYYSTA